MSTQTQSLLDVIKEVTDEIIEERERQDKKWGGVEHDDQHSTDDFFNFIGQRVIYNMTPEEARKSLVEIAALAVAAVQSMDRSSA